jgi:hypothetical protein
MSDESVLDFYEALGFEETEIEDGLTALLFEFASDDSYALLTNDDGKLPEILRQPIIYACYTPEGAFLWSASFKNSFLFKDIWSGAETPEGKQAAIQEYRESNMR